MGTHRSALREYRDAQSRGRHFAGELLEFPGGDDLQRRCGRIMGSLAARSARRIRHLTGEHFSDDAAQRRDSDRARSQQPHTPVQTRHDGRFQPDLRIPAVEHQAQLVTEFLAHMLGTRRTEATVAVGGRAAIPPPKAVSSCCAMGCEGTRTAIESWPPVTSGWTLNARGNTIVRGPGQKAAASFSAGGGISRAQRDR